LSISDRINRYKNNQVEFPDILYSKFWKRASISSRKEALITLEKTMAQKQGRRNCAIEFFDMKDKHLGYYDRKFKTIILNKKLVKALDMNMLAIDTVIHEGRHSYQDQVIDGLVKPKESDEPTKWLYNRFLYFEEAVYLYYFQPVERDARRYAFEQTKKLYSSLAEKYGKDEQYENYLADIERSMSFMKEYARSALGENYLDVIDKKLKDYFDREIGHWPIQFDLRIRLIQKYGPKTQEPIQGLKNDDQKRNQAAIDR